MKTARLGLGARRLSSVLRVSRVADQYRKTRASFHKHLCVCFGCYRSNLPAAWGRRVNFTRASYAAGVSCETGFKEVNLKHLQPNPHIEFSEAAGKPMPSMKEYRVSVMYSLSEGDEALFDLSLASVIEHFPTAFEVVAVVCASSEYLFDTVLEKHDANAPFPMRLVTDDCSLATKSADPERGAALVRSRRRFTADENSQGAYVFHLDASAVLIQEVTYNVVFHFGKPVMPYGRHPAGECKSRIFVVSVVSPAAFS